MDETADPARPRADDRLLRFDRTIVANEMRSAVSAWRDRLLAVAIVVVGLAALRASLEPRPFALAAGLVGGASLLGGLAAERAIRRRLDFHAYDGVLAAEALRPRSRGRYGAAWRLVVLGLLLALTLAARPQLLGFSLAGYAAGVALGQAALRFSASPGAAGGRAGRRWSRSSLQRPAAGLAAAILVLLLLLSARRLEPGAQIAAAALLGAVAVLGLTQLDDAVIRFLTLSGYGAWRIVGLHGRAPLVFLAVVLPIGLAALAPAAAGVLGGVALAGLVLMAVRILAYRRYSRRMADAMVTVILGAVGLTAAVVPMLLPVLVPLVLWQLYRRSAGQTWMLA